MKTTIILDAMGGTDDHPPQPELEAAIIASNKFDINITLVGKSALLEEELRKLDGDKSRLKIVEAPPEVILMSDHIREARAKKEQQHASWHGSGKTRTGGACLRYRGQYGHGNVLRHQNFWDDPRDRPPLPDGSFAYPNWKMRAGRHWCQRRSPP